MRSAPDTPTSSSDDEPESDCVTVDAVAARLDVHPSTIYRQLSAGTFPARALRVGRSWRIVRADVEALLCSSSTSS